MLVKCRFLASLGGNRKDRAILGASNMQYGGSPEKAREAQVSSTCTELFTVGQCPLPTPSPHHHHSCPLEGKKETKEGVQWPRK